jgi:hypothetical protein
MKVGVVLLIAAFITVFVATFYCVIKVIYHGAKMVQHIKPDWKGQLLGPFILAAPHFFDQEGNAHRVLFHDSSFRSEGLWARAVVI